MTDAVELTEPQRRRAAALSVAIRSVFGEGRMRTPEQRIVWAWLMGLGRPHKPAFDADDRVTAYRLGRQEIALAILEAFQEREKTVSELLAELFPDTESPEL